jgi:hypothetical protein
VAAAQTREFGIREEELWRAVLAASSAAQYENQQENDSSRTVSFRNSSSVKTVFGGKTYFDVAVEPSGSSSRAIVRGKTRALSGVPYLPDFMAPRRVRAFLDQIDEAVNTSAPVQGPLSPVSTTLESGDGSPPGGRPAGGRHASSVGTSFSAHPMQGIEKALRYAAVRLWQDGDEEGAYTMAAIIREHTPDDEPPVPVHDADREYLARRQHTHRQVQQHAPARKVSPLLRITLLAGYVGVAATMIWLGFSAGSPAMHVCARGDWSGACTGAGSRYIAHGARVAGELGIVMLALFAPILIVVWWISMGRVIGGVLDDGRKFFKG